MGSRVLENDLSSVVHIYGQYSNKNIPSHTITQGNLLRMIQEHLPDWIMNPLDPAAHDKVIEDLENEPDKVLEFGECMRVLTMIIVANFEHLKL